MKKLLSLTLTCTLVFAMNVTAAEETMDHVFEVTPGDYLTLKNINGNVEVSVWDRDQVEVVAIKKARGRDAAGKLESVDVEMSQEGDSIRIETVRHKKRDNVSVYYELRVPSQIDLDLKTTNGKITVDGVSGSLITRTTNGSLVLTEIGGNLQASTTNGSIRAEMVSHDGGEIRCKTTNGSIRLDLPDNIRGDLNAKVTNGSINSDIELDSANRSKRSLDGVYNGGGAPIDLKTTNGSIRIN